MIELLIHKNQKIRVYTLSVISGERRCCIDEDGVPEMFIKSGTCEADTVINVYAIRNSAVTMLDSLPGSHSGICGLAEKNAFLLDGGHMGYETIYKLQLSNDTFIWETVFSGQVDNYSLFGDFIF